MIQGIKELISEMGYLFTVIVVLTILKILEYVFACF